MPEIATTSTAVFGKTLFDFLVSQELQQSLLPFKIVFIALTFLFFGAFLYLLFKTTYVNWKWFNSILNFLFPYNKKSEKVLKKWEQIKNEIESDSLAQRKLGLLEAYALLEKYAGDFDSLSGEEFVNVARLQETVQFCKRIFQETDIPLTKKQACDILDVFEKALKDLQII